jgi:hypothetical protein
VGGVELGPEEREEHVATVPRPWSGRRQVRQQCEPLRLTKQRVHFRAIRRDSAQLDFAQQSQLDHP